MNTSANSAHLRPLHLTIRGTSPTPKVNMQKFLQSDLPAASGHAEQTGDLHNATQPFHFHQTHWQPAVQIWRVTEENHTILCGLTIKKNDCRVMQVGSLQLCTKPVERNLTSTHLVGFFHWYLLVLTFDM